MTGDRGIVTTQIAGPRRYLRDGRAPVPELEATSRVMSRNVGKNTGPELQLRALLRAVHLTGYRVHRPDLPGRPDLSYGGPMVAVFVHGCFWHRCPHCNAPLPKSHREFWAEKFRANQDRDHRTRAALRAKGWRVVVVWECQLRDAPGQTLAHLERLVRIPRSCPTPRARTTRAARTER